jgi:hypothetical protein
VKTRTHAFCTVRAMKAFLAGLADEWRALARRRPRPPGPRSQREGAPVMFKPSLPR